MPNRFKSSKKSVQAMVFALMLGLGVPVGAQLSVRIGLPSVRIGINVPYYPNLIPVPGYPVYYDPRLDSNLFFYDGLYWVYAQDNWYSSAWYDGPWDLVEPEFVPDFLLRIPVFYYRRPPTYFLGWDRQAPPRWGEHWGRDWDERRRGWDHWNRSVVPDRAPLPIYQRDYPRDRYPRVDQQQTLRDRYYHYQPREEGARRHIEPPPRGPATQGLRPAPGPLDRRSSAQPPTVPRGNALPGNGDSRAPRGFQSSPGPMGERAGTQPLRNEPRAPVEGDRRRAPTPGLRGDQAPPAADRHPPNLDRRQVLPPPPRDHAVDAQRSRIDRRGPQQGNSGVPSQQRHPDQRAPAQDSQPSRGRADKPGN